MMAHLIFPFFSFIISIFFFENTEKTEPIFILNSHYNTSIRGVSVVDEKTAWVSGTNGWVGRTLDRGKNWEWHQIDSTQDYRTLYAFNESEAIIANAGSPLNIYKTYDGGKNWKLIYKDSRPEIFIDGGDFLENGQGILYGDPIKGHFQFLFTQDNGETWENYSDTIALKTVEGEAGFAASGTGLRMHSDGKVVLASGGLKSRVFLSQDFGKTWKDSQVPIQQGTSSQGIFSLAMNSTGKIWVVGGDYLNDKNKEMVGAWSLDFGNTWNEFTNGPHGYRSSIEIIDEDGEVLLCSGTSGVDLSKDGGLHWELISQEGYHTIKKSRKGNWIILTGSNGRIAELNLEFIKR